MDQLQAIILGIVQGLTEFLPISSSGHLVLFQKWLGLKQHDIVFDVAVHIGTLFSVVTIYYKTFRNLLLDWFRWISKGKINVGVKLSFYVILASVPTAVIGLTLKDTFESLFNQPRYVGLFFFVTGFLLFVSRNHSLSSKGFEVNDYQDLGSLNWWRALVIGVAQGGTIAPGISRSGTTIATGLLVGLPRGTAALFSFLLAVPAILGAGVIQLKDVTHWDSSHVLVMGVGLVTAYVSGVAGLWGVLHYVRRGQLQIFSYYLWAMGIFVLIMM